MESKYFPGFYHAEEAFDIIGRMLCFRVEQGDNPSAVTISLLTEKEAKVIVPELIPKMYFSSFDACYDKFCKFIFYETGIIKEFIDRLYAVNSDENRERLAYDGQKLIKKWEREKGITLGAFFRDVMMGRYDIAEGAGHLLIRDIDSSKEIPKDDSAEAMRQEFIDKVALVCGVPKSFLDDGFRATDAYERHVAFMIGKEYLEWYEKGRQAGIKEARENAEHKV